MLGQYAILPVVDTAPALLSSVFSRSLLRKDQSMYDLTIDDFLPDRLAAIVHWRNDPAVNQYLRQGIRTLDEVQEWYTQYFARPENKLFAVYADTILIGYGTLEHLDTTHRNCEIGIVI